MQRFMNQEKKVIDDYFDMQSRVFSKTGDGLIEDTTLDWGTCDMPSFENDIAQITTPTIEKLRKQLINNHPSIAVDPSTYEVTITKSFVFDACHYLPYHDRRCKYLHGHTYHMDISLRGPVNPETGMVMDYGTLKSIVNKNLIDDWDHGFINEQISYPTAEIMILYAWAKLWNDLPYLYDIKIWETDGSCAELTREDVMRFING